MTNDSFPVNICCDFSTVNVDVIVSIRNRYTILAWSAEELELLSMYNLLVHLKLVKWYGVNKTYQAVVRQSLFLHPI